MVSGPAKNQSTATNCVSRSTKLTENNNHKSGELFDDKQSITLINSFVCGVSLSRALPPVTMPRLVSVRRDLPVHSR